MGALFGQLGRLAGEQLVDGLLPQLQPAGELAAAERAPVEHRLVRADGVAGVAGAVEQAQAPADPAGTTAGPDEAPPPPARQDLRRLRPGYRVRVHGWAAKKSSMAASKAAGWSRL